MKIADFVLLSLLLNSIVSCEMAHVWTIFYFQIFAKELSDSKGLGNMICTEVKYKYMFTAAAQYWKISGN